VPKNTTVVGVDLIDSNRSEKYFVLQYVGAFLTTFVPKAACCYQIDLPMPTPKTNHTSAFRVGCYSPGKVRAVSVKGARLMLGRCMNNYDRAEVTAPFAYADLDFRGRSGRIAL